MRKGRSQRYSTYPTAPVKARPTAAPFRFILTSSSAGRVADAARGYGHPRTANPVFGAGWGPVTGDRALMVSSALYVAENGRVFVAFRAPHLHYACGAPRVAGRGESPGRAGARRPYQPGHDATRHRGRYRGQAQARRAPVSRSLNLQLCDTHVQQVRA